MRKGKLEMTKVSEIKGDPFAQDTTDPVEKAVAKTTSEKAEPEYRVFTGALNGIRWETRTVTATVGTGNEKRVKMENGKPVVTTKRVLVLDFHGRLIDTATSNGRELWDTIVANFNSWLDAKNAGNEKLAEVFRNSWYVALGGKVENGKHKPLPAHSRTIDPALYVLPSEAKVKALQSQLEKSNTDPTRRSILVLPDNPLRFAHKPKAETIAAKAETGEAPDPFAEMFA